MNSDFLKVVKDSGFHYKTGKWGLESQKEGWSGRAGGRWLNGNVLGQVSLWPGIQTRVEAEWGAHVKRYQCVFLYDLHSDSAILWFFEWM